MKPIPFPKQEKVDRLVGKHITAARESRGLSRAVLAARLEITEADLIAYEAGRKRLGAHRLWVLAETLGLKVDYFFREMG